MKQPYYSIGLALLPLTTIATTVWLWTTMPEARLYLGTILLILLFLGLYVYFLAALFGGKK